MIAGLLVVLPRLGSCVQPYLVWTWETFSDLEKATMMLMTQSMAIF